MRAAPDGSASGRCYRDPPVAHSGYTLFDTAIGRCGIAWNEKGVTALQLPEARDAETRARLARRCPGGREMSPPASIQAVMGGIGALLDGRAEKLDAVPLDMDGVPPFHRRVYEVARTIPAGATLSYGEVARRLGSPGSARAVGQALGRNPFAIIVPCHRVLAANGKVGGFSASGGVTTKLELLALEQGKKKSALPLFEGDVAFTFDTGEALNHLRRVDTTLGRLIDEVGPFRMRLESTASVFAALAQSIVYQQLTGKAAGTIFGRVTALCSKKGQGLTPERILGASEEALRGAGLSRAKLLALKDLARKTERGELPELEQIHAMDNGAIIDALTTVRGIGPWTVEMFLMFRLGRPDVLPVDDYGIRKGFAAAFKKRDLPSKKDLARRGARWQPYRTVASWYLWRAAER